MCVLHVIISQFHVCEFCVSFSFRCLCVFLVCCVCLPFFHFHIFMYIMCLLVSLFVCFRLCAYLFPNFIWQQQQKQQHKQLKQKQQHCTFLSQFLFTDASKASQPQFFSPYFITLHTNTFNLSPTANILLDERHVPGKILIYYCCKYRKCHYI